MEDRAIRAERQADLLKEKLAEERREKYQGMENRGNQSKLMTNDEYILDKLQQAWDEFILFLEI